MEYKGLPIYRAEIDLEGTETGMFVISLVDAPATMSDFMAFDQDRKMLRYNVESDEKRQVFGLVMAADMPIYRRDDNGFEYYITYSKETIALMAEKYLRMGLQNNVDTQHSFELEEGVFMNQIFIKDTEKGVSPKGYEDYKDGSLFAQFHISNDDVWESIKKGEYKGFSLAGVFNVVPKEEREKEKEINKEKKDNSFMKIRGIKEALKAVIKEIELSTLTSDKGIIGWDTDGEIEVGTEVYLVDDNGDKQPIEDGDYVLEDGRTVVVKESKVEEIKEKAQEEEPKEETKEEETVEVEEAEEKEEEKEEKEEPKEEEVENPDGSKEGDNEAIEELRKEVNELYAVVDELTKRIEELENKPAAEPVQEDFKRIQQVEKTGNKGLDQLSKRLGLSK